MEQGRSFVPPRLRDLPVLPAKKEELLFFQQPSVATPVSVRESVVSELPGQLVVLSVEFLVQPFTQSIRM
jgi:hypothetical protein